MSYGTRRGLFVQAINEFSCEWGRKLRDSDGIKFNTQAFKSSDLTIRGTLGHGTVVNALAKYIRDFQASWLQKPRESV